MLPQRFLLLSLFTFVALSGSAHGRMIDFPEPIDAVSLGLDGTDAAMMRAGTKGGWLSWQELARVEEQDPQGTESNLAIFNDSVKRLQILDHSSIPHPIRVSHAPATRLVAATRNVGRSRILTREEWGADNSLLYASSDPEPAPDPTAKGDYGSQKGSGPSTRITDCEEAQRDYPEEFVPARTVTASPEKKDYRWPLQYSKQVRLLVVHHTAIEIGDDPRPAVERVRALYQFHAQNRGWGDIGYHYIIDEDGEIYEGRQGGDGVVGGHVYCGNVGTVGVALLGNFELERPTQSQMQSLQWLLAELADNHDIPLDRKIRFHGKILPTIVRHRDLVSTECPGYYVRETIDQIRTHVAAGTLTAAVDFPKPIVATVKAVKKRSMTRRTERKKRVAGGRSTGPIDRRLAVKLKSQPVTAFRRQLRNRVEAGGGTARPGNRGGQVRFSWPPKAINMEKTEPVPIRIRLTSREVGVQSCADIDLQALDTLYRGTLSCVMIDGKPAIINAVGLEDYMAGLAEEPDTEPFEKQKAFAIAARSYAAYWADPAHRKWEGMPYDGTDSPAVFQAYGGIAFEKENPQWVQVVRETAGHVLMYNNAVVRAPYFSSDAGKTRSPAEAGWSNFPLAEEVFYAKDDPWCAGNILAGHGVGMSGCGAEGQAEEGKSAEQILEYYYPGTMITPLN